MPESLDNQTEKSKKPKKLKKPKKKRTLSQKMRRLINILLALIATACIAAVGIVAYMLANPEQAAILHSAFGIDLYRIKDYLTLVVDVSFKVVGFILFLLWLLVIFRAFVSRHRFTKIIFITLAVIVPICMISLVAGYTRISIALDKTNFANPSGAVIMYDNDLLRIEESPTDAIIRNSSELIGPIVIRFNLDGIVDQQGVVEEVEFELDMDGDGSIDIQGAQLR